VSLFFLSHKYYMKSLQLLEKLKPVWSVKSSVQKADQIVWKMKEVTEWAQMTMTVTQQIQKKMTNQKRQQSYDFKKEDKIWLNLKNIHTDCLYKKFDAKNVSTSLLRRSAHISFVWTHCWVFIMCFTQSCFSQQSKTLFLLSVWQICNPYHKL
jgi:hypothetical protein